MSTRVSVAIVLRGRARLRSGVVSRSALLIQESLRKLASQSIPTWNRIVGWLEQMENLRNATVQLEPFL